MTITEKVTFILKNIRADIKYKLHKKFVKKQKTYENSKQLKITNLKKMLNLKLIQIFNLLI